MPRSPPETQVSSPRDDHPRLVSVRSWRVKGFPNYLILYEPVDDGILVLAIIHGARDLERFLKGRV
ncbi:MAG TPA: type II toxin-antitoxin system RelE/ParE family toxin [Tepidisphaeraceae bacterium]|nr:type II toxin-antitoxin system RelE/ParE family toxin [Tepidisphaeraceae bacterium]